MSTKLWLDEWVARKRREVAAEEPLSIQTNIAALSQRLWKAEQTLEQVRRACNHNAATVYGGEGRSWSAVDRDVILRILGGGTDA